MTGFQTNEWFAMKITPTYTYERTRLYYVMLCYVMLCCVALRYIILYYIIRLLYV